MLLKMRCSFLVIFLMLFHNTIDDDLIQQYCKKAADHEPSVNYDFCVSTIEAHPKSHSAHLATLIMTVLDLAGAKVTNFNSHIQELKKDPKVDQPTLQDYEEVYLDATSSMQEATNSFKAKNYESTLNTLSAAMNAPDTCETGFQERKAVSPLKKEDDDFT
ncbi:putative pectinesterase inhibitor domain-containing protein [Rosa chinensis]|uniref:Putative pectinesterase inhibitor domain-containing protein n=2 Tax=Rosa chinensis TaxID=74649 RepID=A0A2P6P9S6_ROSCH|nr:putative pectinesterase inhibitor domain-containing protein [Rosa chinensis]